MLAGELVDEETGVRLVVLADPDPIANHGLGRGDAPLLVAALMDRLGPGAATVVLDETLHGHELQPSLARELLRFPLVLATAQALLALALLAWAALVRFGRPRPAPPPLAAGKEVLLDRTAALLLAGGSPRDAVRAYLAAAKEQLAQRLRPPGSEEPNADWLARTARARGRADALAALEAAVAAQAAGRGAADAAVRIAQEIHRFREYMTHGARRDP
jgi:hypothetical protein